jgi:hypothetical protein
MSAKKIGEPSKKMIKRLISIETKGKQLQGSNGSSDC